MDLANINDTSAAWLDSREHKVPRLRKVIANDLAALGMTDY